MKNWAPSLILFQWKWSGYVPVYEQQHCNLVFVFLDVMAAGVAEGLEVTSHKELSKQALTLQRSFEGEGEEIPQKQRHGITEIWKHGLKKMPSFQFLKVLV